jgi:hypothetical protein
MSKKINSKNIGTLIKKYMNEDNFKTKIKPDMFYILDSLQNQKIIDISISISFNYCGSSCNILIDFDNNIICNKIKLFVVDNTNFCLFHVTSKKSDESFVELNNIDNLIFVVENIMKVVCLTKQMI